jgi:hypothetical protein
MWFARQEMNTNPMNSHCRSLPASDGALTQPSHPSLTPRSPAGWRLQILSNGKQAGSYKHTDRHEGHHTKPMNSHCRSLPASDGALTHPAQPSLTPRSPAGWLLQILSNRQQAGSYKHTDRHEGHHTKPMNSHCRSLPASDGALTHPAQPSLTPRSPAGWLLQILSNRQQADSYKH